MAEEPDIRNVLSKMLPMEKGISTEEAVPTGIMMDFPDDTGKVLTIYSTTGDQQSPVAFQSAIDRYRASGDKKQAPKGYTVLEPGWQKSMRDIYEGVNQPVQKNAPLWGARAASAMAPTGFVALAEKLGLMKPGSAQSLDTSAQEFGAAEGKSIADSVKTPGAAAMTGATIATTPLLGAVTKANTAGKMVAAPLVMLGNAILQGGIGGTAANLAEAALGNTPKIREAAAQFAVAGINGGLQSVLSGIIGRYVTSPIRQREVAEGVLGEIKKSSPGMLRNPDILDRYASAEENLKKITSYVSSAIRGTTDDLTDDFMANLGQIGKMNLTVGEQATMRMHARNLAKYSKETLDSLGDTKAINSAQGSYVEVKNKMLKLVDDSKLSDANKAALRKQVEGTINQYTTDATNSIEGAQIVKYLEESGAGNGWNVNSFADVIRGKRTEPGSLLENIGKTLGFNLPGGLGVPPATRRAEALGQAGASVAGGKVAMAAKLWSKLRGAGQPPVNTMPWQRVSGSGTGPASASLYGQNAIRNFLEPED